MTSRLLRIHRYLASMLPLWQLVPMSAIHFLAIYAPLQAMAGQGPLHLGWRAIAVMATVLLYSLLLRSFDEMKDVDSDRRLAESGDPWFLRRPLVTGAIFMSDLRWMRTCILVLLILINALMFDALLWTACFMLLTLAWLSSKWFFIPTMRNNLLLALVTHNPLALAVEIYITLVAVADGIVISFDAWIIPLLVGLWLPMTAWELSRKIRMPADETAYQTYSQVFGLRLAGLLPGLCTVISALCLMTVIWQAKMGTAWLVVVALAGLIAAGKYLQFVLYPTRERAQLKRVASFYAAAANIAMALGALSTLGVRWSW